LVQRIPKSPTRICRATAIFKKLETGPEFTDDIEDVIPHESVVEEVQTLITPTKKRRLYPIIVGEHGTGKTSLLKLAVGGMDKDRPKGVAYIDLPLQCNSEIDVVKAMQKGLGWSPDPVIDFERNYSSPLPVSFFWGVFFVLKLIDSQRCL
jgi:hypothetical protein